MIFEFNRYSSLLLIFFVHGLVYSLLLYRKSVRRETRSDKWLSIFLLLCILHIAPWMLGFAGWYDQQPFRDILFYTPFQHLFFVGPILFFYVQSLLNPSFRFGKKEWLQLIPGGLYIVFSLVMLLTDKIILQRYFFLASGADPDFDTWYQLTGFASMIIYLLASIKYYHLYRRLIVQVISNADTVLFAWVRNFLMAFLLMLILRMLFFVISYFMEVDYWGSWWYYFVFAILFYYVAITGYANSVETKVGFRSNWLNPQQILLLNYSVEDSNRHNITEDAEVIEILNEPVPEESALLEEWKDRLTKLFTEEKIYEDAELSLSQLARLMDSQPAFISRMINQGFSLNFNDFVNQFRIQAVQDMLLRGEQRRQTFLGIAYECGFNSKATFNRAFKKATGLSPKEWVGKNISSP